MLRYVRILLTSLRRPSPLVRHIPSLARRTAETQWLRKLTSMERWIPGKGTMQKVMRKRKRTSLYHIPARTLKHHLNLHLPLLHSLYPNTTASAVEAATTLRHPSPLLSLLTPPLSQVTFPPAAPPQPPNIQAGKTLAIPCPAFQSQSPTTTTASAAVAAIMLPYIPSPSTNILPSNPVVQDSRSITRPRQKTHGRSSPIPQSTEGPMSYMDWAWRG